MGFFFMIFIIFFLFISPFCSIHVPVIYYIMKSFSSTADIFGKILYSITLCSMFFPFFFPVLRPLTKSYQEVVRSVFTSSASSSGANRRQAMKDLQEEFSNLYNNIRLFEKGAKHFTGTKCILWKINMLLQGCLIYFRI